MPDQPVVIVGAGLAGLNCARVLLEHGMEVLVLDRADGIGGRLRTDRVDGFLLDRGFQVLQTAYPEAQKAFDYQRLGLHSFEPGAMIRTESKLVSMADPWRHPSRILSTAFNGIGTISDRWKLALLRRKVTRCSLEQLESEPEMSTRLFLQNRCGFSADFIDRFLRPWFTGVFLESDLESSHRFFQFVFRMLALGNAALPEKGMGALAEQLAEPIPNSMLRLQTEVRSFDATHVTLSNGQKIDAQSVVLAVDPWNAASFKVAEAPPKGSTCCLQFAADHSPIDGAWLVLSASRSSVINHLCVPSNVCSKYAPANQNLISVSTVGVRDSEVESLESQVRNELRKWFGSTVDRWSLLATQRIPNAVRLCLPGQNRDRQLRTADGVYCCWESGAYPSIHSALKSGRLAAEAVLDDQAALRRSA